MISNVYKMISLRNFFLLFSTGTSLNYMWYLRNIFFKSVFGFKKRVIFIFKPKEDLGIKYLLSISLCYFSSGKYCINMKGYGISRFGENAVSNANQSY